MNINLGIGAEALADSKDMKSVLCLMFASILM